MNHRFVRLSMFCLLTILLFTGCQQGQPSIPVTGDQDPSLIKPFEEARGNVLTYVTSSARVANAPQDADWQWDITEQVQGQHHFHSGDWRMIVWDADDQGCKQIILVNRTENIFWSGYVRADGRVVDTNYSR